MTVIIDGKVCSVHQVYDVIQSADIDGLIIAVQQAIDDNWRTVGGIAIRTLSGTQQPIFYQAMETTIYKVLENVTTLKP